MDDAWHNLDRPLKILTLGKTGIPAAFLAGVKCEF